MGMYKVNIIAIHGAVDIYPRRNTTGWGNRTYIQTSIRGYPSASPSLRWGYVFARRPSKKKTSAAASFFFFCAVGRPSLFQVVIRRLLSPEIDMKGAAAAAANDDAGADAAAAAAATTAGEGQDHPPEEHKSEKGDGGETSPSSLSPSSPAAPGATTETVRQQ